MRILSMVLVGGMVALLTRRMIQQRRMTMMDRLMRYFSRNMYKPIMRRLWMA